MIKATDMRVPLTIGFPLRISESHMIKSFYYYIHQIGKNNYRIPSEGIKKAHSF